MAESAPVNDVLCGAVEYLVKLGTNLRQRSETLKHKRIRKDRLRNTHAVQKAASKVLLLCQLSKKSIKTVEASIETILSQIAKLQGNTNGGKSSSSENISQYEYFVYNSKRLKIRNKVNIKHYTSAKVVASVMPTSMQDRYPVFYDCKLYRIRMKALNHNSKTNVSESEIDTSNKSISKTNISSDKKDDLERQKKKKSVKFNNSIVISDENQDNNVSNSSDKEREEVGQESSRTVYSENEDKYLRKRSTSRDVDNDKKDTNESMESRIAYSRKTKKFKHIKINIDDSSSDQEDRPKTIKKHKDSQNIKTSDSKSIDVVENSLVDNNSGENETSKNIKEQSEMTKKTKLLNKGEQDDSDINIEKHRTSHNQPEDSIKTKHDKTLNTSCEQNESISEEPKEESSSIENAANNIVSERESIDNKHDNDEIQSEPKTKNYESDKSVESNASKKSFIKCVSITKLLKPDKIPTLTSSQLNNDTDSKESKSKMESKNRHSKKSYFSTSTSDSRIDMKNKSDEYWKQKRKEVKDFKAKKFTINITRLPKLTDEYLESQNLKRIVQNEHVICEITSMPKTSHCESNGNQSSIITHKENLPHTKDMIAIKKSLLNGSDSEQTDEDIRQVNEIVKKSLLCDSDSDKDNLNGSIRNVDVKSDDIPPDPNESSQNENTINSNKKTIESKVDNEKSKSTERQSQRKELNVSNEANNEVSDITDSHRVLRTPDISTEQRSDISEQGDLLLDSMKTPDKQQSVDSPPSKRKRIMESMHAKKMLLTYSSSSDTDDEHLRNVLKEIKNDLLKVDDNSKDNMKSTSSSDPDNSLNSKKSKDSSKSHSNRKKTSPAKDESQPEDNSNSTSSKMDHSIGKSSSGSQHSNSEDSDKDINGLTNLKTLRKSRRRRSKDRSRWRKFRMAKMPKAPVISEEVLLQPDSASDVASEVSNEDCEVEELPRIPVTGLNGDCDTLAKDDLLADSDSSISQNENKTSQDDKEGDSEEENLKAKRRKANAISSDSEAGSSRRKDRRISDFEDSEDDGLDSVKKSKRKKNRSESDSSLGSNEESKKKRRRIKNIDDSEGSGSETENEGRNKHGRKNIRKVMGKNQLEEATKKAAREEKERIARIAERQKLYNNLQFDESGKPDEVVLDKVVLDFDPETKEPIIQLDKGLVKKLKPHQANGIKFMWDACFESVKRIKKGKGSGCILAHCMGLGKTLQVVSLTHTLLTHGDLTRVSRVLVVCPLSTVLNWVNEFKMWLKHTEVDYEVDVYELSRFKQNSDRAFQLSQWYQHGGVCVLGYEMFRNLSSDSNKKFKKKMLKNFQEALVDPGPDLVVCDEGHLLKNEKTSLSQAMNKVKTLRRIVLTGTPLQNNLKEYYCMVQFVKPNLLGKYNEYLNRFVNPITNGQYTDSTEHDIKIMKRRSHVLHTMLDGAVQRRDYGVLAPFLPPKHEYVLFITLTEVQIKLYTHYLDNYSRRPLPGKSSGFLFPDFQSLQRIWTHPLVLKYNSERYEIMQQKKREREEEDSEGSLVDFIDDDSTPDESSSEESTDDSSVMSDDSRKKSKKKKSPKKSKGRSTRRGTRANPVEVEDDDVQEVVEVKNENPTEWWMSLVNEEELDDVRNSHKLVLLFDILRQCEAIGDKLLVFSQSLYSLDLIEHFLGKIDEATQEGRVDDKLGGHVGSWSPGVDYFRLDGSTSCENRSIWCKNFNREDNPRARLFLISTRAGGLGINLVAANRVVIFDVSWNPSHDVQSIFRVYRFGQKKPCYVYRFLVMGTMEEKIYERQVTKQAISKRVIDEQQIDRHYAENDLAELYKFEPKPPQPRPIPPLPKDRLFAEMLKEHEQLIYKYHEHDSLLENKEEETLTEEERKAAWEDFENEKTRPPPVPFASPYAMHNGMMPGLLAQQQQLAYATVAAMLRKEAPTITENQIRDMMPLIYSANPQLMQKMSEMYKYPQSGMVNPGMMNAVMNPGGGGMPMGGSSGLQYEPPWQRQQQMRLQQLMQQQNQMGAKYYSGGLGSRDPVAMALQHQRAREMMLGERSRPRGRPPLHAAGQPPRAAPQDVVNLDSD